MFGPTMTISSDLWKQNQSKQHAKPNKWILSDLEDGGGGVIPYIYNNKNYVNALQWCIGLELFLMIKDPWRVFLTTDHPNGAPFTSYPELIRLLMDSDFRNSEIDKINISAKEIGNIKSIDDLICSFFILSIPAALLFFSSFTAFLISDSVKGLFISSLLSKIGTSSLLTWFDESSESIVSGLLRFLK